MSGGRVDVKRPIEVVVLNCCVTETKEAPLASSRVRQWLLDPGSICQATSTRFADPATPRRLAARAQEMQLLQSRPLHCHTCRAGRGRALPVGSRFRLRQGLDR
jgi:hypothetical protein